MSFFKAYNLDRWLTMLSDDLLDDVKDKTKIFVDI